MTMMLNCAAIAARGLVGWYLAGRVTPDEVEAFESHYLTCDRCQQGLLLGVAIRASLRQRESQARPARSRAHHQPAEVTLPIAISIALTEPNSS